MKRLLTLAEKARDRFTQNSLQWFIREQLEEATSMDVLLQIGRRTGGGRAAADGCSSSISSAPRRTLPAASRTEKSPQDFRPGAEPARAGGPHATSPVRAKVSSSGGRATAAR